MAMSQLDKGTKQSGDIWSKTRKIHLAKWILYLANYGGLMTH